jgi:hypothetical protein
MQRLKRFPFSLLIVWACFTALMTFSAFSVEVPVETRGYIAVEGGNSIQSEIDVFIATFDEQAFSQSNNADIVLIEEMLQLTVEERDEDNVDDDTIVYSGKYQAMNLTSGEEFDSGRLALEIAADSPMDINTNVVGFFRRSGPWIQRNNPDGDGLLSDMEGTIEYTTLESTRDITIALQGVYNGSGFTINGETSLSVVNEDTATILRWQSDETDLYELTFSSSAMLREGNTYDGFLFRSDSKEPDFWQSRYALIRVVDTNDSDGDGVPDFSDLGSTSVLGVLQTNSISTGKDQVWSPDLNTTVFYSPDSLWLYGSNLGWFYLPSQDDPDQIRLYVPDARIGWIWTNQQISPVYVREADGGQLYFALVGESLYYYDYSTESWYSLDS